jgi:hypothetical protein
MSHVDGGDECSMEENGGSSCCTMGRCTGMVGSRESVACCSSRISKAFPG